MRSINNVRWLVKIDKEMGAESKERTLIRTVEYLIGEHLEGLTMAAARRGDDTFEYELKINQLDDTKTHWNYEIKLDRAHIWSIFGTRTDKTEVKHVC
jgi:hypothetical protein